MLKFVLNYCDNRLDYYVEKDKIVITTKYLTRGPIVIAAYDVSEMLSHYDVEWNRKKDALKLRIGFQRTRRSQGAHPAEPAG
jgi:hypothetical protein